MVGNPGKTIAVFTLFGQRRQMGEKVELWAMVILSSFFVGFFFGVSHRIEAAWDR